MEGMTTRGVLIYILFNLLHSALNANGLSCAGEGRPYPPSYCVTLSEGALKTSPDAVSDCGSSALVTFEQDEQFDTLTRYVEVLQQSGPQYWVGYRYNSSNVLVDYNDMPVSGGSPLLESSNYATTGSQAPEADGTCLAIGREGGVGVKLFRMSCNEMISYICSEAVSAPSITSLTTSVSRFLTSGSSITLTCAVTDNDAPVMWRRDMEDLTASSPDVTINEGSGTLTVNSYDGMLASYECVAGSQAGRVVSQAVVLNGGTGAESPAPTITQLSSTSTAVQFGTGVTLTCEFTTTNTLSRVEWFVNGVRQETTNLSGGETQSMYVVDSFAEDGIYQCRVFNQNDDNSVQSLQITGRAGTPGPVNFPIALSSTQTEVFVSWLYPTDLNVLDPLLLRYEVHYQQGNTLDEATATAVTGVLPTLLVVGGVLQDDVVEYVLSGLSPGSMYVVTIRAVSSAGSGELNGDRVIVSTFGNVPTVSVDNLKVLRTRDNKTLFADWDDLKTEPPTGPVSRYWVEYRDSNKDDAINSAILSHKYSYLVVFPIEDAQNYQVRVRAGVITNRVPLTYEYGPYSKWVEVRGITATVPPIPPGGVLPLTSGAIAAAVVVPVLVVGLIALIMVFGVICFCLKKNKPEKFSGRKRLDSQAVSLKPPESSELPEKELDFVVA